MFEDAATQSKNADEETPSKAIAVAEDDGDAMLILCNILHLRNDKLPIRMTPDLLFKMAVLCGKYQCAVAAGRATVQWFDRLYSSKEECDSWKVIEAAFLLDEAVFFARFTSRWVLSQPINQRRFPVPSSVDTQKLAGRC